MAMQGHAKAVLITGEPYIQCTSQAQLPLLPAQPCFIKHEHVRGCSKHWSWVFTKIRVPGTACRVHGPNKPLSIDVHHLLSVDKSLKVRF